MKKLVESSESEGLEALMGEMVTLFCCRYIYTGKLIGLSDTDAILSDAGIVYETGSFDNKDWSDMQKLPNDWGVKIQSIESFGLLK
jgi:hypothetical protein